MPNLKSSFLTALLLSLPPTLGAAESPFIGDADNTLRNDIVEREWREGEVVLPERINEHDLQEFQVEPPDPRFRYFIERGSLRTSDDGVTRFVLVIRSKSGAVNSSYEGLRCGERQYKVYAYGTKDGLQRLPGALWQEFQQNSREPYRKALYNDLLCDLGTGHANAPAAVFRAMRTGERVRTYFNAD